MHLKYQVILRKVLNGYVMHRYESLTDKQRKIVFEGSGKFAVRAIAGSGKTYVVSARISKLLDSWQFKYNGIAILSFTNVACREIETTLSSKFSIQDISYPHYLGTFDSFVNKFIFLPFGHKILRTIDRPKLVGEPFGHWHGNNYGQSFFDKISYKIDGELFFVGRDKPRPTSIQYALSQKKILTRAGFATQSDANYFALEILKNFPSIAKTLVKKFPYFIIDEAQDLSDIQMAIVDKLIEHGLNEVMFVGDPDQAIYEWRNSLPELFIKKTQEWAETSFIMDESRRSSQLVCNFAFKMSSLGKIPMSDNPIRDAQIKPDIVMYELENIKQIADSFIEQCLEHKIEVSPSKVAIVFRSASVYDSFSNENQHETIFDWTADKDFFEICKARYLYENGQVREAVLKIKKIYVKNKIGNKQVSSQEIDVFVESVGIIKFNISLIEILKVIPPLGNNTLLKWGELSKDIFEQIFNIVPSYKKKYNDLMLSENFKSEFIQKTYKGCHLSTIHKVKGETYDAVLVILKTKGLGKAYTKLINENIETYTNEELRNVYVAVTRPRLFLRLAVPSIKDLECWNKKFFT